MIAYPPSLKAVGGARTGIAPAHLLDVLDVNGNLYYWSDRPLNAPVVLTGALDSFVDPPTPPAPGQTVVWSYPTVLNASGPDLPFASAIVNSTIGMSTTGAVDAVMEVVNGSPTSGFSYLKFSGFTPVTLPAGVTLNSVVAVVKLTGTSGPTVFVGSNLWTFPGTRYEGLFTDVTVPSDLTTYLAGLLAEIDLDCTSPGPGEGYVNVEFVGVAVYYSGGNGTPGWGFPGLAPYGAGPYIPWIVQVPAFTFNRSLITDIGSFVIQNLSGDTLSRDFEKIARRSALEGAQFVYRLWQADAQAAWLEVHGTLTVQGIPVDTVKLKGQPLINPSQMDTPAEILSETCQLQYGGRRCGATSGVECKYSFQSCQVIERPFLVLNNYEKNYGEAQANTAYNVINRRRTI